MSANPNDIQSQYQALLHERRGSAAVGLERERRISRGRLACVLAAIATFWVGYDTGIVPPAGAILFVFVFAALVVLHDRVIRARKRDERAAAFYERGLARVEDRWIGTGSSGEAYLDPNHPYSGDLDLFGHGSLFERLSLARTLGGEQTLARWLSEPAPPDVVALRQRAIDDLRERLALREDLAVIGEELAAGLEPDALVHWAQQPQQCDLPWARIVAPLLVVGVLTTAVGWSLDAFGPLPFLGALAAELAFAGFLRRRVQTVLHDVQRPTRDLALLVDILSRLERETFHAPLLTDLAHQLDAGAEPPSQRIAQLRRRVDLLDTRKNELFAPLAALLLWGTQCALAIEAWRRENGGLIPTWLAAVHEMEALISLGAFAAENPDFPFPRLRDEPAGFDAIGLAHPLLPRATRVANDVHVGPDQRVLMVSGSNMSGKSTLLRSVGINVALAQAGAPVCAVELTLSPLTVGASLRIVDSLQSGTSHFYAELKRLRQIVDLTAAERPVLFLLDEVLHGTNSHDRRIGADAVVRELVRLGAFGLVTTHDLALAEIANDPEVHAVNVHFEDHIDDGVMRFDYQMRPGVVRKSNALELMRAVGLAVGRHSEDSNYTH